MTGRIRTPWAAPVPVVLLVGMSDAFVAHCRTVTTGAHTLIRHTPLDRWESRAEQWKPLVIAVAKISHDKQAAQFQKVSRQIRAVVVVLPGETMEADALRALLEDALVEADEMRQKTPSEAP